MKQIARLVFTIVLFFTHVCLFSQLNKPLVDSLKLQLQESRADNDKIFWTGELVAALCEFDSIAAKSYADEELKFAEGNRNRRFIMGALFTQIRALNLKFNASQSRIDKAISLANQVLAIARESNDDEYQGWAYLQLSDVYTLKDNNKSLEYAGNAVDVSSSVHSDSLSVDAFVYLGDANLTNGNKIVAFRNYLKAYNIVENGNNPRLTLFVYERLSEFYGSISQPEKQKDYLIRAVDEAKNNDLNYQQCWMLLSLGDVYSAQENYSLAEEYLKRALSLADSIQFDTFKPQAYLSLTNNYKSKKDYPAYLKILHDHPEIEESFAFASGNGTLDKIYRKAVVFKETEKYDSAVFYYRQIEDMLGHYDINQAYRRRIFLDFGGSLIQLGDYKEALTAYKSAQLYSDRGNPVETQTMARWFDTIYHRLGDYQSAYSYKLQFDHIKDSLDKLSKQDEVLMKEIDNETQRNDQLIQREEENTRRRHNIQYMGITVSILVVFTILIMMGFFSLSVASIQGLGFFAFLLLFEFIILLADNIIHSITHGEPWKVLIIKIGIAAILLPLHHYAEEKAVHYFTNRKKLKMGGSKLFRKMTGPKKPI